MLDCSDLKNLQCSVFMSKKGFLSVIWLMRKVMAIVLHILLTDNVLNLKPVLDDSCKARPVN